MKYSFHCKHCGFTFMSDDKTDVALNKKYHKYAGCNLKQTKRGTLARRGLAEVL